MDRRRGHHGNDDSRVCTALRRFSKNVLALQNANIFRSKQLAHTDGRFDEHGYDFPNPWIADTIGNERPLSFSGQCVEIVVYDKNVFHVLIQVSSVVVHTLAWKRLD